MNLDFLLLHTAHFNYVIVPPLLVFEIIGLMLSIFSFFLFFFFCALDNKIALFYTLSFKIIALKEDNLQKMESCLILF